MMKSKYILVFDFIKYKILLLIIILLVASCSPPQFLPTGPTPIPTLIPATIPPSHLDITEPEPTTLIIESYPAGLPSALSGQDLYNENCASCHGADGKGVVPNARDFTDVDYVRGESPANFYSIISEGREEEMPAFGQKLTSDQRWAVVYYMWRFSTSEETLQQGYEIYRGNCIACHGDDGRSMILGALNFSDHRFMANQTPSDLYVSVTQGVGSMPAWQARLSQDNRWAVIDFIRTFTYSPGIEIAISPASGGSENIAGEREECASYLELENPFEWGDAEAISAGQTLFKNCTTCHGDDGTGRLPGIIDFTDPISQGELNTNPINYFCTIAEGYQGMPSFKEELNESDIWQLLTFLASLGE